MMQIRARNQVVGLLNKPRLVDGEKTFGRHLEHPNLGGQGCALLKYALSVMMKPRCLALRQTLPRLRKLNGGRLRFWNNQPPCQLSHLEMIKQDQLTVSVGVVPV
jgi:hypothetical protein